MITHNVRHSRLTGEEQKGHMGIYIRLNKTESGTVFQSWPKWYRLVVSTLFSTLHWILSDLHIVALKNMNWFWFCFVFFKIYVQSEHKNARAVLLSVKVAFL